MPDPRHGIFETLLVIDGRPVELDTHLERLTTSLTELFPGRKLPDLDEIEVPVGWGSLRIAVRPAGGELRVRTSVREVEQGPQQIALHSLAVPGGQGAHKWVDRSLLDKAQAGLPADALPLIVDADGTVLEASRANVFTMRNGVLHTPPLDGRILPGVTRGRVLEIAAAADLDTRETELSREDLLAAEEVFLTGSVRGIERVRSLDGAALAAGETAASLAAELRRTWAAVQVG